MKRIAATLALIIGAHAAMAASHPRTTSSGTGVWDSGLYQYDALGNIVRIGADQYFYDSAQRLVSGTADVQRTNVMSEQHYGYDSFGNRISAARSTGSKACVSNTPCELAVTINPVTNHITSDGGAYDAAGNLTVHAEAHYVYDSLNMIVRETERSNDFQFVYTPDDERVGVDKNGSWTWTVRGADRQVLRDFTSTDPTSGAPGSQGRAWKEDYVLRNGKMLASVQAAGVTHFHLDQLGTPRLLSDQNGFLLAVHSYYPFGAELDLTPRETPQEARKFTGHERDATGDIYALDYMHARYYSAATGRFVSLDPARATQSAPESWHRYAYTYNNPMASVDPDGRFSWTVALNEARKFLTDPEKYVERVKAKYFGAAIRDQAAADALLPPNRIAVNIGVPIPQTKGMVRVDTTATLEFNSQSAHLTVSQSVTASPVMTSSNITATPVDLTVSQGDIKNNPSINFGNGGLTIPPSAASGNDKGGFAPTTTVQGGDASASPMQIMKNGLTSAVAGYYQAKAAAETAKGAFDMIKDVINFLK